MDTVRCDECAVTRHLASAEASVFLIESLLRLLVERNVLSHDEVIEVLEETIATKKKMAEEGVHPRISAVAAGILCSIANSLQASRPRTVLGAP
jgi:hypothetical protein